MIFVDKYSREEWEQKYTSLKLHPTLCPDCNQNNWEDGIFYPWISKEYVGILRVCPVCKNHQNSAGIIDRQESIELYSAVKSLLGELNE